MKQGIEWQMCPFWETWDSDTSAECIQYRIVAKKYMINETLYLLLQTPPYFFSPTIILVKTSLITGPLPCSSHIALLSLLWKGKLIPALGLLHMLILLPVMIFPWVLAQFLLHHSGLSWKVSSSKSLFCLHSLNLMPLSLLHPSYSFTSYFIIFRVPTTWWNLVDYVFRSQFIVSMPN